MRIKKPVNLANISSDLGSPGAAIDWDLIDNNSSALSFDTDGKAGILNIVTTNGAEGVELSGFLSVDGATTLSSTLNIASNALLSGGGADGKLILSNVAGTQGVLFDTSTDGQLTLTDESDGNLDLQIGGQFLAADGSIAAPGIAFANQTNCGLRRPTASTVDFIVAAEVLFRVQAPTFNFGNNSFGFAAGSPETNAPDAAVGRSAAGKLLFGNGALSQAVLFDTTTDGKLTLTDESAGDLNLTVSGNRLAVGGDDAGYGCINQTVSYSDFTDGGGVVGTLVLDEGIPDGAVVQQCILHTLTGFTGGANSTATITVGDGTDVDRYNTGTPDVYTSNASGVDLGSPSGTKWHDDAKNVTLTVTTDSDFSTISAGSFKIAVFYFTP